jgi:hypothetical protein
VPPTSQEAEFEEEGVAPLVGLGTGVATGTGSAAGSAHHTSLPKSLAKAPTVSSIPGRGKGNKRDEGPGASPPSLREAIVHSPGMPAEQDSNYFQFHTASQKEGKDHRDKVFRHAGV